MSTFRAEVVRLEIIPHSNADKLEIAKIRGWSCVVLKSQFRTGDLAIYIPVGAMLPDGLVKAAGIEKYYNKRLRTQKLRGVVSQGLVIPTSLAHHDPSPSVREFQDGDDVTDLLGIKKYEEIIPVQMSGVRLQDDPRFIKYTGIENIKNFPGVLVPGEEVVVTEKIHGTSWRVANFGGELMFGSHNVRLALPRKHSLVERVKRFFGFKIPTVNSESNLYWRGARMAGRPLEGYQIFGEIYGHGVQDLGYGVKPGDMRLAIFDVHAGQRYLNYGEAAIFCAISRLEMAPLLYCGPWDPVETPKLASGDSVLCPGQIREGAVVRPAQERVDPRLGRVILKIINDDYLVRMDSTERH